MDLVRQPEGSNQCGQACVAMVLGVPLEEAVALVGTRGRTRTRQVAAALRSRGVGCGDRLEPVRDGIPGHPSDPPRRRLEKVLWVTGDRRRRSHWVLIWDGAVYDPAFGVDPDYYECFGPGSLTQLYRVRSFLRLP